MRSRGISRSNECKFFKKTIKVESKFMDQEGVSRYLVLSDIEVKEVPEKHDVKKTPGSDGASNKILRECSKQLPDKIQRR